MPSSTRRSSSIPPFTPRAGGSPRWARSSATEERKIGEVPYRYPVIKVERIRLWPKDVLVGPAYYPYPWGFGPFGPYYYDPFYLGRAPVLSRLVVVIAA